MSVEKNHVKRQKRIYINNAKKMNNVEKICYSRFSHNNYLLHDVEALGGHLVASNITAGDSLPHRVEVCFLIEHRAKQKDKIK